MSTSITILGIAGSLRKASYNRGALRAAQELAPAGARIEIFDLDGIPPFNQDHDAHPPEKVIQLKKQIRAADAILICTPEYNYSIPGVLKNAIDWASRPYGDSAWLVVFRGIRVVHRRDLAGQRRHHNVRRGFVLDRFVHCRAVAFRVLPPVRAASPGRILRIPTLVGHLLRFISDSHSNPNRTLVTVDIGQ